MSICCDRCGRRVPNPSPVCLSKYAEIGRAYRCWDCEDTAPFGQLHFFCLDTADLSQKVCTAEGFAP